MRCFKSFFQHTWHPQQMVIMASADSIWDYPYSSQATNAVGLIYGTVPEPEPDYFPPNSRIPETRMESLSRFELTKTESKNVDETELAEVKATLPTNNAATSTPQQSDGVPCHNKGCKSWPSHLESRLESPWHFLKSVFLISVIVALVLWVIVYASLSQYRLL